MLEASFCFLVFSLPLNSFTFSRETSLHIFSHQGTFPFSSPLSHHYWQESSFLLFFAVVVVERERETKSKQSP